MENQINKISYPVTGDIVIDGMYYPDVQAVRDAHRILGIPTKDVVDQVEHDVRGAWAAAWVAAHEDDDEFDSDELRAVFVAVYGREPDAQDEADGLWSLICAAS